MESTAAVKPVGNSNTWHSNQINKKRNTNQVSLGWSDSRHAEPTSGIGA